MMIGVLGISGETCLSASSDLGPEKKSELTIKFFVCKWWFMGIILENGPVSTESPSFSPRFL